MQLGKDSDAVLKSVNKRNKLLIWENTFIYKHTHMNLEVLPENSLITKYVYRPLDSASIASTNITTTCNTTCQSI